MSESEVLVDRLTKSGIRTFDARTAVIRANVEMGADCAILQVVVRHGVPAVRPDDVLAALKKLQTSPRRFPLGLLDWRKVLCLKTAGPWVILSPWIVKPHKLEPYIVTT